MAVSSASTFQPFLKQYFNSNKVESYAGEDAPTFALMPRNTEATGEIWKLPIQITNPQGVSNTFADALDAGENSGLEGSAFLIPWVTKYGIVKIPNTLIEQTQSNKGALLDALEKQFKGVFMEMGRAFEADIFNDGFGSIGVIGSISTDTITLATPNDVYKFRKGMRIEAAVSKASGAKRAGYGEVLSVDEDAGTVRLTANVTTAITSAAAADFLFRKGDRHATAASKLAITGFGGFIPRTAPIAAENFYGVDRSISPIALAGSRFDCTGGLSMREALNKCLTRGGQRGCKTTHVSTSWSKYEQLRHEMGDRVMFEEMETDLDVIVKGIKVTNVSHGGSVTVVPSYACPDDYIWGWKRDTWELASVNGPTIKPSLRGGEWLDYQSEDSIQARYRFMGALGCSAPFQNWIGYFV